MTTQTVEVNDFGRDGTQIREILCVTSDGKWCRARLKDDGRVLSFGGTIWPGELPTVFVRGTISTQCPVNHSISEKVREHLKRSVARLVLPLTEVDDCFRCGQAIDAAKAVWLELDSADGKYKTPGSADIKVSQGSFAFGPDCARRIKRNGGYCD